MAENFIEVRFAGKRFDSVGAAFMELTSRVNATIDGSAQVLSKELANALTEVAREMFRMHGQPWSANASPGRDHLLRRTGGGLRGILRSVKVNNPKKVSDLRGQIGAPFPISVHERGAVIKAKQSDYLTIPLPPALSASGVPLRRRARDWPNTFVNRSRSGNLLIFRKERAGTEITPLYILKREVRLPPRLRLMDTLVNDALPMFERRAFEAISKRLDQLDA